MIEIKAILKKYKALIVFENCSMTFEDNSINVIYGRNGIGKTTLLNLIANQSSLDQGSILIDGKEQLDMNAKLELFFVPDKKEAFNNFTGRELFDFIAILYKQTNNDIERYIELLDMQSNIDKLISTYSLGMKQKIWILAMIKSNANNILLDEPYNSLDEQSKEVLTIILKQLAGERKCILTVTHDLNVLKDESYNLYNIIDRKIIRK